jgi:hypothetical protein
VVVSECLVEMRKQQTTRPAAQAFSPTKCPKGGRETAQRRRQERNLTQDKQCRSFPRVAKPKQGPQHSLAKNNYTTPTTRLTSNRRANCQGGGILSHRAAAVFLVLLLPRKR